MLEYYDVMIPQRINEIIVLFAKHNLNYCLFKCEHIFAGENKNLDILFKTKIDYEKAAGLLEKTGFVLYLPERIEKFKKMYVRFSANEYTRIHLHREIAWHGLKVIDKKDVFDRKKETHRLMIVPSTEDQIIIHIAHIIFENWKINNRERELLTSYLNKNPDWEYINSKLAKYGWKKSFYYVLRKLKEGKKVKKSVLIREFIKQSLRSPHSWYPLTKKTKEMILRKFNIRRKGCLISLMGVNGSGKTTLVNETLRKFEPLTNSISGQFGYYYGYIPFSPWARWLSRKNKKKKREIFKEMNQAKKNLKDKHFESKYSLRNDFFFLFNHLEYSLRFWFEIYPRLRRNKLVITDRYFYDLYGQYNTSSQSKTLLSLFRLFPKPDHIFVLDAPVKTIVNRDKNPNIKINPAKIMMGSKKFPIKSPRRTKHDAEYLQMQRERYAFLQQHLKATKLDTTDDPKENIKIIIDKSWRTITN